MHSAISATGFNRQRAQRLDLSGVLGFPASGTVSRLLRPVQLFDAAGLCLFAVTGTLLAGSGRC